MWERCLACLAVHGFEIRPRAKVSRRVVGQQDKPPPLQHVAEMVYVGDAGEELPVKSGVSGLRRLQLLGKEAQRLPDRRPLAALVQPGSDMSRRSVDRQAEGSSR